MEDETKVAEAPAPVVEETVKAPEGESLIEKRRREVENQVITENEPTEVPTEITQEPKLEEAPETDTLDKIKKSVQKRIDKVVAQKKSVEEQLAEAQAELERLRSKPSENGKQDDKPPTPEQVEAYIIKMREEGNVKEEVAAMRYLVKLEKDQAIAEVRAEQTKADTEAKSKADKQLKDWTELQKDYIVYTKDGKVDQKNDLTLANQSSVLYKTALALYNDKELHADFYNDPNVMVGFRRAVADAYREIHQQGLIKTPKGEEMIERRPMRTQLAEPGSESSEEPTQSSNLNSLSDAEKVREEIKARKANRFIRPLSQR